MVNNEEYAGEIILKTFNSQILQNLKDSDCDSVLIEQFFNLEKENKIPEQIKLLKKHKTKLLDNLHKYQKHIDNLDFLIFNLEQTKK